LDEQGGHLIDQTTPNVLAMAGKRDRIKAARHKYSVVTKIKTMDGNSKSHGQRVKCLLMQNKWTNWRSGTGELRMRQSSGPV